MIKWIKGVPPAQGLKENELILVVCDFYNIEPNPNFEDKPFVAEYAEGALHDMYDREPFDERCVVKWSRIEGEPEPELSDGLKEEFSRLMYGLTKTASRISFVDWLETWGIAREDYDQIKVYLEEKYGVKPYV